MLIRSWLFVPGDSERKIEKARGNPADALILDLEDAVADERQAIARDMVKAYLVKRTDRSRQQLWVRVNPLDSDLSLPDLAAVMPGRPDGIVLSKVNAANDVNKLCHYLSALEAREGIDLFTTRIFCVATETAASSLTFHTYLEDVTPRLAAMTWGARICPLLLAQLTTAIATGATTTTLICWREHCVSPRVAPSMCNRSGRCIRIFAIPKVTRRIAVATVVPGLSAKSPFIPSNPRSPIVPSHLPRTRWLTLSVWSPLSKTNRGSAPSVWRERCSTCRISNKHAICSSLPKLSDRPGVLRSDRVAVAGIRLSHSGKFFVRRGDAFFPEQGSS